MNLGVKNQAQDLEYEKNALSIEPIRKAGLKDMKN